MKRRREKHGLTHTRIHRIWVGMRTRCFNQRTPAYELYGARGITICERWNSLANSAADMGPCPPRSQIERIDNNKGYSPENCRWATSKEQARNRRSNRFYSIGEESKTIPEWCERFGMPKRLVYCRVSQGWPLSRALTEPVHVEKRNSCYRPT